MSLANRFWHDHRSPTYRSWKNMMNRCFRPTNSHYKWYGAKGITVCDAWKDFENFASDMGERPAGKTLDRIDLSKGYCKENCQWATNRQQAVNRTDNRMITLDEITAPLTVHCERRGVKFDFVRTRLNRGWSVIDAFTIPKLKTRYERKNHQL